MIAKVPSPAIAFLRSAVLLLAGFAALYPLPESPSVRFYGVPDEIAHLTEHPWAGHYARGDGFSGDTLSVAPTTGFEFESRYCTGKGGTYGTLKEMGRVLVLTVLGGSPFYTPDALEYESVRWGQRAYLVPRKEIISFANEINSGGEPRHDMNGMFLLREGDHKKPASGRPQLPAAYRKYLLAKPIKAHILDIPIMRSDEKDKHHHAADIILDAGWADGLLHGMQLSPALPDYHSKATVLGLGKHTSELVFEWYDYDQPLRLSKGMGFSTRDTWRDTP